MRIKHRRLKHVAMLEEQLAAEAIRRRAEYWTHVNPHGNLDRV